MKRHRINSSFHYILVVLMILSFMMPFAVNERKAAAQAVTAGVKNTNLTDVLNKISGPLWTIGSTVVVVVDSTRKEGFPMEGDTVNVRGQVQANGSILASRIRTLNLLRSKSKAAVVKPVVAPPAPSIVTETRFTGKVNGTGTNMWLVGTTPVAIDANTKMLGTPAFSQMAEVRGIQQANGIVLATQMRSLSGTGGSGVGTQVRFKATVEDIASSTWVIGGFTVAINAATKIIDNAREGDSVEVIATRQADLTLLATEIRNQANAVTGGTSGGGTSGGSGSGSGSGGSGSGSGSGGSGSGSSGSGSSGGGGSGSGGK